MRYFTLGHCEDMLKSLLFEIEGDLVKEEILKEINDSINEELSISNQLKDEAFRICGEIVKSIKNTPTLPFNIKNVSFKGNNVFTTFFGEKINIIYKFYNFFYKEDYDNNHEKIDVDNRSSYMNKVIYITIFAISGNIIANMFNDTMYHELEHFYQSKNSNKEVGNKQIYKIALWLKNSGYKDNYIVGDAIYLTRDFEQDAYINGLYGFLIDGCTSKYDVTEKLKRSDAYDVLYRLKHHFNYILNNKEKVDYVLKQSKINFNYNNFINMIKKAINRFENKIGKVVIKVNNDIIEKYGYTYLEHFKYTNPLDEPIFAKDIEPIM